MRPGDSATRNDALCPSCDRFIGPADVCPYCGEDSARQPALKILRRAAVVFGLLGVGTLYLMARLQAIPVTRISAISPQMNFARICVAGTVTGRPYVSAPGGKVRYLSFVLDDGSGRLRVIADGQVARDLAERGGPPAIGARVTLSGSLRIAADGYPAVYLRSAAAVNWENLQPPAASGGSDAEVSETSGSLQNLPSPAMSAE